MIRSADSHGLSFARLSVVLLAVLGLSVLAFAGTSPPGAAEPGLDGARILYFSTGGLATIDQSLRVFDDGTARFEWRRGADGSGYTVERKLPVAEVASLKRLFRVGGFEAMPRRFVPEGVVMDGVRILIKAELADGTVKSVRTETLAVEDPAFVAIRRTLEGLIADIRGSEMLRVRSYLKPFDGRERFFTLLADGRYRVEVRKNDLPIRWVEGYLRPADREAFLSLSDAFDFSSARLCEGDHKEGVQHDVFRSGSGGVYALHFSEADPNARFECLDILAKRIGEIVTIDRDDG